MNSFQRLHSGYVMETLRALTGRCLNMHALEMRR